MLTEIEGTRLFAPGFHLDPRIGATLELIRGAILNQRKLLLHYSDAGQRVTERSAAKRARRWPISCEKWKAIRPKNSSYQSGQFR